MDRPYKITDRSRMKRFGVVVSSFQDLIQKAQEKFAITSAAVKVLLDSDATEVDELYFNTLEQNTCLMIISEDEEWIPPETVDVNRMVETIINMQKTQNEILKTQNEMLKALNEVIVRTDKKHDKFLEVKALFFMREAVKLIIKRLNIVRSENQFTRLLEKTQPKKVYTSQEKAKKFKQFQTFKIKLVTIEDKLKKPRNKAGHPVDSVDQISLDEFQDALKTVSAMEDNIISEGDVKILSFMAQCTGIKSVNIQGLDM